MAEPSKRQAGAPAPAHDPDVNALGPVMPINVRVRTRTSPAAPEPRPVMPTNVRVRERTRTPVPEPQEEPEPDYEVGYKKPPQHSRFEKGKSGNPNGRPKGARNLRTELLAEITELITVRENGRAKKVPKLRAYIKRLSEKALNGDLRAILALCTLVRTHLPEPDATAEPDTPLAEEDLALLMEFAGRQRPPK